MNKEKHGQNLKDLDFERIIRNCKRERDIVFI